MFGQSVDLIAERYHVSKTAAMLPTSLFLFGLAAGPLIFAPVTERYGRKVGILTPFFVASLVCTFSYFVHPFAAVLFTRVIGGFFASAPIISSGGALKDLFEPGRRADILLGYAILVASGPAFGPILGMD